MHASLFSLVTAEDHEQLFALGMEITDNNTETEDRTRPDRHAILYIGTRNGQGTISTHTSAEAAHARWNHVTPLKLVRNTDTWTDLLQQPFTADSPLPHPTSNDT